ncbi:MAG: hypothetical protein J0H94_16885 [Rhizobiales bacterium]|nr:hypothetical protein [Hyphomicrobiales bacterium]
MTEEDRDTTERVFWRRRTRSLATLIAYARDEAEVLKLAAVAELLERAEREALAARAAAPDAGPAAVHATRRPPAAAPCPT